MTKKTIPVYGIWSPVNYIALHWSKSETHHSAVIKSIQQGNTRQALPLGMENNVSEI